jgi:Pyridoxal-phosphate dependent enzyme
VSQYLKSVNPSCRIVLADPPGSSLFNKVKYGVCYSSQQAESKIKRHRYDSIVEGIGLDRVTHNFSCATIDDAILVSDQDTVNMSRWALREEGLFVGSSSAVNLYAAYKLARELGPGHTIVAIVCDSGQRHLSRFWNNDYLSNYDLISPSVDDISNLMNMQERYSRGTFIEYCSLYFPSYFLHFTSFYISLLHFTLLHFTSLYFTSLHFNLLHFISPLTLLLLLAAHSRTISGQEHRIISPLFNRFFS